MSQNVVFKTLYHNLKLLQFQAFLTAHEKKYCTSSTMDRLQFNEKMFEKPNQKGFEIVTYFLFTTLDKENKKRFQGCFPCNDRKQEADFRKGATECFRDLDKQQDAQIKFLPVLLHNPFGVQFCNLYISLSNYVLAKYMKKRFNFDEKYSQLDDESMKSITNESLQKYDHNEKHLVNLKRYWEEEATYFIERHKMLRKQLEDIKLVNNPATEFDETAFLKEIKQLESDWESLHAFVSNVVVQCYAQLKLVDEELDSSFDVTEINKRGCSLDLCELLYSSKKPIEKFFKHVDSMSSSKLRDVHSHIALAKVQLAKHNVEIAKMSEKLKEDYEALKENCQKLRSDLLNSDVVKKRKDWFKEKLPTMFPKLVFEPKRMENISLSSVEPPKRVFEKTKRMSDVRYSFHFADISTLHYVPPPIMEESCILSPVREGKKYDSFDSFELEKEKQNFLACD